MSKIPSEKQWGNLATNLNSRAKITVSDVAPSSDLGENEFVIVPGKTGSKVNTDDIVDGAVTSSKIGDKSITTGKLADKSVTGDKMEDNSVSTSKIQDGAITGVKISWDTNNSSYVRFGKILICWGKGTMTGVGTAERSEKDLYIEFPKTFTSAPSFVVTLWDLGGAYAEYISIDSVGTTSARVRFGHAFSTSTTSASYTWIAIGQG